MFYLILWFDFITQKCKFFLAKREDAFNIIATGYAFTVTESSIGLLFNLAGL